MISFKWLLVIRFVPNTDEVVRENGNKSRVKFKTYGLEERDIPSIRTQSVSSGERGIHEPIHILS